MIRHVVVRSLLVAIGLAVTTAIVSPAQAAQSGAADDRPGCPPASGQEPNGTDFDGDAQDDTLVGVPGEDIASVRDAGGVEIRYGGTCKAVLGVGAPGPAAGDRFGTDMVAGSYVAGGTDDLLVGAPGRTVDGKRGAGAIYLFAGSTGGLRFVKELHQGADGIPGEPQENAHFGASLDGRAGPELVGAPGYSVGSAAGAGAIVRLSRFSFTADDVPTIEADLITEGSPGVPGTAAAGDAFGSALTSRYFSGQPVIGAPGKRVSGAANAGAIFVLAADDGPGQSITQDSPGVAGAAEPGDRFGAALVEPSVNSGVRVGIPGEAVGDAAGAGMVEDFTFDAAGQADLARASAYTQNSAGVPGTVEAGDGFGSALHDGYIGAPDEDVGSVSDAGSVQTLTKAWSLATAGVPGAPLANDRMGSSLDVSSACDWCGDGEANDTPLAGLPGRNGGAGAVLYSLPGISSDEDAPTLWQQRAGVPEPGDGYGGSLV